MRVFEKTFGIDGLENLVKTFEKNLQNPDEYDPSKNKFNFHQDDLEKSIKSLKDFKTRHNAIYLRIQ